MNLYPLPLPDLPRLRDRGDARLVTRGPSTLAEILERGRVAMLEQEQAEEYARDPVAYIRAHRPRWTWPRWLTRKPRPVRPVPLYVEVPLNITLKGQ